MIVGFALTLPFAACSSIDALVSPPSGPCEITALEPGDPDASLASRAACIIVTWDTTRFPLALTADGGVGEPQELRESALRADYAPWCSTMVTPGNREDASATEFAARFGSLTPDARAWGASLFLLDQRDGAGKNYCRAWMGIE